MVSQLISHVDQMTGRSCPMTRTLKLQINTGRSLGSAVCIMNTRFLKHETTKSVLTQSMDTYPEDENNLSLHHGSKTRDRLWPITIRIQFGKLEKARLGDP